MSAAVLSYPGCVAETEEIARSILPNFITTVCNLCWEEAQPSGPKLRRCSRCRFVHYCSAECQSKVWREHRKECERLTGKLEEWRKWPSKYRLTNESEGRFRMDALLVFRLLLKRDSGQLTAATGKQSGKTFADERKLAQIGDARLKRSRLHEIADAQRCASFLYGKDVDDATILEYCNKIMRNGVMQVKDGGRAGDFRTVLGITLYLDCSTACSCRPNAQFAEINEKMRVIPLPDANGKPLFDAHNISDLKNANPLLGATKGVRQGMIERRDCLTTCECERCLDPEDDFLSAIVCQRCSAPIPVDDSSFRRSAGAKFSENVPLSSTVLFRVQRTLHCGFDVEDILVLPKLTETRNIPDRFEFESFGPALKSLRPVCSCGTKQSGEHVEYAFAMMTVTDYLTLTKAPPNDIFEDVLSRFDVACAKILPDCNLYRAKFHRLMADDPNADPSMRVDQVERCLEQVLSSRARRTTQGVARAVQGAHRSAAVEVRRASRCCRRLSPAYQS